MILVRNEIRASRTTVITLASVIVRVIRRLLSVSFSCAAPTVYETYVSFRFLRGTEFEREPVVLTRT